MSKPKAPARADRREEPKVAMPADAAGDAGPEATAGASAPGAQALGQAGSTGDRVVAAPARGPWYTCGLGGKLRAQDVLMFAALVMLTYAAGLILLWVLVALLLLGSSSDPGPSCGDGCAGCGDCGCGSCGDCGGCGDCGCGGCGDCGGCGCLRRTGRGTSLGLLPLLLAPKAAFRRIRDGAWAHHPAGPAFAADVFTLRGARLCVGCFTVFPAFLAVSAWLATAGLPGPWWTGLAVGLPAAAAQAVSSAGLARWRWTKVWVKGYLGIGLALAVHAVLASGWARAAKVAALGGLLGLAMLSAIPRGRRLRQSGLPGTASSPDA